MLGRVVVENGVKKIVPLTADCGSGNPVGTVIAVYSNKVPNGYLPCNGVAFDTAQFPVLYALLGDDHTPDLRECTLVGIGQSDRTMGAHDVYTVGQFKDDQVQDHRHKFYVDWSSGSTDGMRLQGDVSDPTAHQFNTASGGIREGRTGTTTHGKQVGVNWCIKATSGINENQADDVLSALSPVDVVALNNVHSVTSNAVARALQGLIKDKTNVQIISGTTYDYDTNATDNYGNMNVFLILGGNNGNNCWLSVLTTYGGHLRNFTNFGNTTLSVTEQSTGIMRFAYNGDGTLRTAILKIL